MSGDDDLVALDRQLCFMLYAASRAMTRAYQPMLAELGITYPQYLVLMVLWEWQGDSEVEATVTALGRRLYLDSGTLTPLLKRLEGQQLLCRTRDPRDERRVLLSLTAAGLALRQRALDWLRPGAQSRAAGAVDVAALRRQLRLLLEQLPQAGQG
ncbi:MarR family transcriptional regulator [Exilibacterium tricleocarpae]|uniref:MarR family transcriptional regulator n=1 Tax=Exilibacterium tricleocarpae TaxID=2591008 RepID=A0A545TS29_9GAMM|nr:MarR family transcriptional regulator [Exilibacterium tricleocarpae]TQV80030.1 MarR family transcriptional regulator [Exilibacterium tricleocarpae]